MAYEIQSTQILSSAATSCRTSLAFRLIPQSNAILDCSPITAAGHVIPQSYVPISVSQFMDDLSAEEDMLCCNTDNASVSIISFQMTKWCFLKSIAPAIAFFCKVIMLWGLFRFYIE